MAPRRPGALTRLVAFPVGPGEAGARLDRLLASPVQRALGAAVPKAFVRRLIVAGAVRVSGRVERRPGRTLDAGARVEAAVRMDLLPPPPGAAVVLEARDILYEDDLVIVVAKPPGLATVASADPRQPHLVGAVEQWLARSSCADPHEPPRLAGAPSTAPRDARLEPDSRAAPRVPYVGVHQRLDRDTSGVVLFAKSAEANGPLAAAFAGHRVVKVYHALTARGQGDVPRQWTCDEPLAPGASGRGGRVEADRIRGRPASTACRVLASAAAARLVEARPRTGRKHQVRAHLAASGLPILGDVRYGGPAMVDGQRAGRLMLHAARLDVPHPRTGRLLRVSCPHPPDFVVLATRLGIAVPHAG